MNIGLIKKVLESAPDDANVCFDFCDCVPTKIESWRGIYAEPAVGWDATGYSGHGKGVSVKDFLTELYTATSGKVYTGWKGGEYTYTDENNLHVDNPGDCTHTEIVMVEIGKYVVVLHTRRVMEEL